MPVAGGLDLRAAAPPSKLFRIAQQLAPEALPAPLGRNDEFQNLGDPFRVVKLRLKAQVQQPGNFAILLANQAAVAGIRKLLAEDFAKPFARQGAILQLANQSVGGLAVRDTCLANQISSSTRNENPGFSSAASNSVSNSLQP